MIVLIAVIGVVHYSFFMKNKGGSDLTNATSTATSTASTNQDVNSILNTKNWIYSSITAQGIQFMYPKTLTMKYIGVQSGVDMWPPTINMTSSDYTCVENNVGIAGPQKRTEKHIVDGKEYCVVYFSEGAAGSTYTTYEYTTKQGDFTPHLKFVLRFPQCMNYDDPNQTACKSEQSIFNSENIADKLADKILSSIRMR